MKRLLFLVTILISFEAIASGGYTYIGVLAKAAHIPEKEHILTFIFIGLLIICGGLLYRIKLGKIKNKIIPDKGITFRNMVEAYGSFIYGECKAVLGDKDASKYFPYVATIFLVILVSNLIGLIPGFAPPTAALNTTLAIGIFSFCYYNLKGIKEQGFINYIKHFCGPMWVLAALIFPIEILSNIIRPVSLALRLQGNMMGDHTVMATFTDLAPFIVPIPFYLLGILVCIIQAYVFTMLSMVYLSLATEHQDHDESHAH